MTIFIIKIIACVTMVLDHIKYVYEPSINFATLYLGRIAFPLFAFLATEGYKHTSNLKKYCNRLIIFGIISQIPFMIFRTYVGEWMMLNIMFTILFGILAISAFEKIKSKFLAILSVIVIIISGDILRMDYGSYGILMIFILYLLKDSKFKLTIFYILLVLSRYFFNNLFDFENIFSIIFTIFPIIIILLYNGKEGKKTKYFYYWFYPIHLIILDLIAYLT